MKNAAVAWCANCDKRIVWQKQLCRPCHAYQLKYHRPRPAHLWDKQRLIVICACGDLAVIGNECRACRAYRYRNGAQRPDKIANRTRNLCKECGYPAPPDYYRTHGGLRRGLCNACYRYQKRHGRPRPVEIIRRIAPLGWCDECSRPAHRIETFSAAGRQFTLRICTQCDDPA